MSQRSTQTDSHPNQPKRRQLLAGAVAGAFRSLAGAV